MFSFSNVANKKTTDRAPPEQGTKVSSKEAENANKKYCLGLGGGDPAGDGGDGEGR
jgi:hypothetical protein